MDILRTGACFPDKWVCDGQIQCPTAIDELDCDSSRTSKSPEISHEADLEIYVNQVYISHPTFPNHYRNNLDIRQDFSTNADMIFVLFFELFDIEVDRISGTCADFIKIRK
jgi:hypothetical protein